MEVDVTAVRLAMIDAGLSAGQLAKAANISKQTVIRYTHKGGNGNPVTLHKIGVALGVKPSSLVKT